MADTLAVPRPCSRASTLVPETSSVSDLESQRSQRSQQSQVKQPKQKSQKPKKSKGEQGQKPANGQKQQQQKKVDKPFYQSLGEELLASTQSPSTQQQFTIKSLPPLSINIKSIPIPPIPTHPISPCPSPMSEKHTFLSSTSEYFQKSKSTVSLALTPSRRSEDSVYTTYSGSTKVIEDQQRPNIKYKVKGTIFTLKDFQTMQETEELVLRYGRTAHMGVRDPSYSFWMNRTHTCVVHFKVLNKVAVLGGDPICHPDRLDLSMREFESYCRKVGWKTAIIGGSDLMQKVAKARGWTTMCFGSDSVLNPATNEVLLGKSGKRIVTQCRQLLDPKRGGITVQTYVPRNGRDHMLEGELRSIYDAWRNERNATRDTQAFVTVFDLFSMNTLMTFLYTRDQSGHINGFAALRKLGANNGYHIDPFIQTPDAPRGVSDLLIFASLAMLNAEGCTYLSLGFEPSAAVGEISGMPAFLHNTTRKVYAHVFGKIPVGGKEAFFARWKPDAEQTESQYLVFVGKVPSPRFMVAMTHFANISLRSIVASDWAKWRAGWTQQKADQAVAQHIQEPQQPQNPAEV